MKRKKIFHTHTHTPSLRGRFFLSFFAFANASSYCSQHDRRENKFSTVLAGEDTKEGRFLARNGPPGAGKPSVDGWTVAATPRHSALRPCTGCAKRRNKNIYMNSLPRPQPLRSSTPSPSVEHTQHQHTHTHLKTTTNDEGEDCVSQISWTRGESGRAVRRDGQSSKIQ